MALQVSLTLNKTYFLPGEVVQVSVQICNDADSASQDAQPGVPQVIHIKELSFQAYGSERTDPNFIHRLHRPDVSVDSSDSRKQVRTIFSTEPAVLVNDQMLAPRAVQHFQLRFRLPAPLPPSFRGSSVRFLYLIQVKSVYEVHRGGLEAVVYETTASTSLMVWPSTGLALAAGPGGGGAGAGGPDRRSSSLDASNSSTAAALGAAAAAAAAAVATGGAAAAAARESLSRSNTAGGGAGPGPGDSQRRLSSAGGVPPSPSASQTPTHASSAPLASPSGAGPGTAGGSSGAGGAGQGGGADDSDVGMIDYVLGRNNCRIRWQEVFPAQGPGGRGEASGRGRTDGGGGGGPGSGAGGAAPSFSAPGGGGGQGGVNTAGSGGRSVIPFGVNRPFSPPFPNAASNAAANGMGVDSDLDDEDEGGAGRRLGAVNGSTVSDPAQGSGSGTGQGGGGGGASNGGASGVQRQLSSGTAGLGPYARQPSRRGSLFGKVYALNVGDQPLLRLLMQAPLEVPLQPGATFGGVLDFRPPASLQPQPSAGLGPASSFSSAGGGGPGAAAAAAARPPVACHDVVVLLESEEVVAAECRPQGKRDGSGIPGGTPYVIRRLHAEAHELTPDTALTSFTFSLPATATPSFRTPMVSLRWVLRFELTVGPRINFAALDKRLKSPRPTFEQLVWSLPLVVRPPVAGWGR
ncbi:hypothetical protein HYH02_011168 [Chlamydomonas schloesseri]|uniref:Uncharacterized protein n=1 Tax=Chlamydomonas schloesseri TaxID=2026947 RepID=A0A835TGW6_9CHLO|nr:hypothetical protein HYH02_011168 [Chlamydomonas schloesseri]|eukprot:KAG2437525.1 hypothetical protein HYH02_011168 [Chlamydomonas schloesseri]